MQHCVAGGGAEADIGAERGLAETLFVPCDPGQLLNAFWKTG
jgi:hypothetical protein